jgi:hypothetical protein
MELSASFMAMKSIAIVAHRQKKFRLLSISGLNQFQNQNLKNLNRASARALKRRQQHEFFQQ